MVHLEPVTRENLSAVLALRVREGQKGFVSTTAESLAQAYVYRETAFPFAVYDGKTVVGFIMLGYYEAKQYYTLWKLLISEDYQGKGYGREALKLGITFLRDERRAEAIYTGVSPGNAAAKALYTSFGFQYTGVFEDNMEELRLVCKKG